MNMSSEELVKSSTQEERPEALRPATEQVHAESRKRETEKNIWHRLKDRARLIWSGSRPVDEVLYSEENLYHAERLGMTPQELHRLIEKSRLYERIARGSALVEVEHLSQKLREGR
jgi:hypothetical protein